jgi:hypothetical protein
MEERRMNDAESNTPPPASDDLEPPSAELVEKLNEIMEAVFVPAGTPKLNPNELSAMKQFACQLPISQGFNPGTLHFLHRVVVSQFVVGTAKTTVDWSMLLKKWTDICVERNRQHLVGGLPSLLNWCFEPSCIRVIGLIELEWDADNRQITIQANQPNLNRMTAYLKSAFNIEAVETTQPPISNAA